MSDVCGTCGRPPRADGSAHLGDEWVNPEASPVRRDCTRFGRALLEPRVFHPYLTIECEHAGRLAALAECDAVRAGLAEIAGLRGALAKAVEAAWREGYASGRADGAAYGGEPPDYRLLRRFATWEESEAAALLGGRS